MSAVEFFRLKHVENRKNWRKLSLWVLKESDWLRFFAVVFIINVLKKLTVLTKFIMSLLT